MTTFCPRFKLVVWKVSAPGTVIMSRVRCKMWSCPHCCKKNRSIWQNFLMSKLPRVSSNWWFATITAHEKQRTASGSLENLRTGIENVIKRARRVWGNMSYVRIYEKHRTGAYHAHLIISELSARVSRRRNRNGTITFAPCQPDSMGKSWGCQTWFKRTCRAVGMGYMATVRRLENEAQAVRYVVKYMTKDAQGFYVRGLRRIQTSVRIGSPVKKKTGGWNAARYVWASDMPVNADLIDLNTKEVIPPDYWAGNVVYPPDV